MVDRVTSSATLLAEARAWAAELSQGSIAALALAKEILNKTFELGDEEVFALGRQAQGDLLFDGRAPGGGDGVPREDGALGAAEPLEPAGSALRPPDFTLRVRML